MNDDVDGTTARRDESVYELLNASSLSPALKRTIKDKLDRGVSEKHLPGYLAEYTYRYNHRNDETPMFFSILRRAVRVAAL